MRFIGGYGGDTSQGSPLWSVSSPTTALIMERQLEGGLRFYLTELN